jgi:hypothetical protein
MACEKYLEVAMVFPEHGNLFEFLEDAIIILNFDPFCPVLFAGESSIIHIEYFQLEGKMRQTFTSDLKNIGLLLVPVVFTFQTPVY